MPRLSTHFCFQFSDGQERVLSAAMAWAHFQVDGFVRADLAEHSRCGQLNRLWYFNLGYAPHEIGRTYGLVPILRPGSRGTPEQPEKLPLLGGEALVPFRCEALQWYPDFPREVAQCMLADSLLVDKSMRGLTAALIARYAPADGSSTEARQLAKGLTATYLVRAR